jgi:DNA-binding PadR family transcriptional regulator
MSARPMSLRCFILGLLTQQSVAGYDIKRMLKSLSWLVGEPSFGSLYPALTALEKDDLVTMELESRQNRSSRKVYSITEEGRQTLEEWISQPTGSNASLKAFAMRLILADNLSQAGLITQLYQRRSQIAAHRAALEKNTALKDDGANSGQRLALEYGRALANAELAWLDSTLDRLLRQPQAMEVAQGD